MAGNLIDNVRDGGTVASIVPVPEGANAGNRLTIHELFHRTDAATLDAVLDAAVRGLLVIPISHTFTLDEIGAAQNVVAAGAPARSCSSIDWPSRSSVTPEIELSGHRLRRGALDEAHGLSLTSPENRPHFRHHALAPLPCFLRHLNYGAGGRRRRKSDQEKP
nr:hypothetical protein [Rhizobium leguminosarum]